MTAKIARALVSLVLALLVCGCDQPEGAPPIDHGVTIWCTPDGHANWVSGSGYSYAMSVPKLNSDGKPVMCSTKGDEHGK